jgi:pimeloyl-ACP methyl ester carboxylesterase
LNNNNNTTECIMFPLFRNAWAMRLLGTTLLLATAATRANTTQAVELAMPGGVVASAWFQPGPRGPAVLLLHGFLQTRNYLTINALRGSLAEQGFTVLAPTLSLGVDRRKASLACEAIHSHTQGDDLAEIASWVAWLEAQGYRDIALLGHSHGSLQLLAYVVAEPSPAIKRLIAISLVGAEERQPTAMLLAQLQRARQRLAGGDAALGDYRLSYCNRYVATPASFTSYAGWLGERVLDGLTGLDMPVRVILGATDARMPADWPQRLEDRGVSVSVVAGAGHFFDAQHEFDLLDEVVAALEGSEPRGL